MVLQAASTLPVLSGLSILFLFGFVCPSTAQLQKPIGPAATPTTDVLTQPTVNLLNGSYAGVYQPHYHQDYFLGMPYAAPPTGNLRLRPPVSYNKSWQGVRNATAYSAECVGYPVGDDAGYLASEDCLTINVIRPAGISPDRKLPVAVWIYGGGYWEGGSVDARYNLTWTVANAAAMGQPVIGVTFNYRVSGWGFLNSQETRADGATNLGIRDQRLALHWVQENIAALGGDEQRVTIWGESAGAGSVGIHIMAYGGRDDGLFRGAIGQSGGPLLLGGWTFASSQALYNNIIRNAGCGNVPDTLQCLRELPFEELDAVFRTVSPRNQFFPQPDGDIIRGSLFEQLQRGDFVRVPYLLGTNTDEGAVFVPRGQINTDADFRQFVLENGAAPDIVPNLERLYPEAPTLDAPDVTVGFQWNRAAVYVGDHHFTAARRLTSEVWTAHGLPAYSYRFNVVPNGNQENRLGVSHFSEVAFALHNIHGQGYTVPPMAGMPESYVDLSDLMSRMWISFINSGNPNHHGMPDVPSWPIYGDGDLAASANGHGQNFVLDVNGTSTTLGYIEDDSWRAVAIAYINSVCNSSFGL